MRISGRVIGVDFDNTIIGYDRVFYRRARRRRWVPESIVRTKRAIRDYLRATPGGERRWQALQATVYGPGIREAALMRGVRPFVAACRRSRTPLYIVSHKTSRAARGGPDVNLRQAALAWMRSRGFFRHEGLAFSEADVFFESSREAKVARVKQLGCTHFIDDLEETFREPAFPAGVVRVLLASGAGRRGQRAHAGWAVCRSWDAIRAVVFGETPHSRDTD